MYLPWLFPWAPGLSTQPPPNLPAWRRGILPTCFWSQWKTPHLDGQVGIQGCALTPSSPTTAIPHQIQSAGPTTAAKRKFAPSDHTGLYGALEKPHTFPPMDFQLRRSPHVEGAPCSCGTQRQHAILRETLPGHRVRQDPLRKHCAFPSWHPVKPTRTLVVWLFDKSLSSQLDCPTGIGMKKWKDKY